MKWFRRVLALAAMLVLVFVLCAAAQADGGTLRLPDSTYAIEEEAFYGDTSLDRVILPRGVQEIGQRAFAGSSVRVIYLPGSLETIASDAFNNTSIQCVITDWESYARGWAEDKGFRVVPENDLGAWAHDGEYWVYAPKGQTAALTADFSAWDWDGLQFEWFQFTQDGDWGDPLPGETGNTLTTAPVNGHMYYGFRVTDAYGFVRDFSFDVMVDCGLRVWPANDRDWAYASNGGAATLAVEASVDNAGALHYQWYRIGINEWGGDDWIELEGQTGTSLMTAAITEQARYVCRVSEDRYDTMRDMWFTVDVDPGTDSVVSGNAHDVGSTDAWVPLTYSVSADTVERGYCMGVAYSENANDIRIGDDSRLTCMDWTWGGESGVYGPANGQTFDGWLDEMIPGHTYYYTGCILDYEGNVIFLEDAFHRFTCGSGSDVQTLTVNGNPGSAPRGDAKTPFRLNVTADGVYTVTADAPANEMSMRRTNDLTYARREDSATMSFYAEAGETVYIFVRDFDGDRTVRIDFTSEPPTQDSVWTSEARDFEDQHAFADVFLTVTPETAEEGYSYGIEYSPYESFRDENGNDYFSGWSWDYEHSVYVGEGFERYLGELVPGTAYYYRGFLQYNNGQRVVETTQPVKHFTAGGSAADIPALTLNTQTAIPDGENTMFRFSTTDNDGVYAIEVSGAYYLNIVRADGTVVRGTDEYESNNRYAIIGICMEKNETAYIVTSGQNGAWLKITEAVGHVTPLSVGESSMLVNDRLAYFTAPNTGWYNITIGRPDLGGLHLYDPEQYFWHYLDLGFNRDTFSFHAEAGGTYYFIAWYDTNRGVQTATVEAVTPAAEDEITVSSYSVGDTWASLDLSYSITEDTLESLSDGYFVGVAYSLYEDFVNENGDEDAEYWEWDNLFNIASSQAIDRVLDKLIPSTQYWYYVYLKDVRTGEVFARSAQDSFTTAAATDNIRALTLNEQVAPRGDGESAVFTFTAPATDVYALEAHGPWNVELRGSQGHWIMNDYQREDGQSPDYRIGFLAGEGETVYIYVINNDENASVTVRSGLGTLPALPLGQRTGELWGRQMFTFTAPSDGWYRFDIESPWYGRVRLVSVEDGWDEGENETHMTRYLREGMTVYPACWFDDDWATVTYEVIAVTPAAAVTVTTQTVTDVTDVSATFPVSFGVPVLGEGQNYTFGVQLLKKSGSESFAGGSAWESVGGDMSMMRWNQREPFEVHTEYFGDRPLEPATTYWYEAFVGVYDEATDRDTFYYGGLKSFTTSASSHAVTPVSVGQTLNVAYRDDQDYQLFSFTVPANPADLYRISVDDSASIWLMEPTGNIIWPEDRDGRRTVCALGLGQAGETYTVYLRVWGDRGAMFEVEPWTAEVIVPGVHESLFSWQLYRFVAETAGDYLIASTDEGADIVAYSLYENGFNHGRGWSWVAKQVKAGESVIFYCDSESAALPLTISLMNPSVTSEQLLRRAVAEAEQISHMRPYFGFQINVDQPITLTQDLELNTAVELHLNAPLTVQSGVTLTNRGDIYIREGGSLSVNAGGALVMRGVEDEWWPSVILDGGTLTVNANATFDPDDYSLVDVHPNGSLSETLATYSGVPADYVQLWVNVSNATELSDALALTDTYLYVTVNLVNGYTPDFDALLAFPGGKSAVIAFEGTNLVIPAGRETIFVSALWLQGGSLTVNGTLHLDPGALILEGGSFVNNGTVDISNNGLINWRGETYAENNGTLTILEGGHLQRSAYAETPYGTLVNNGVVNVSGGEITDGILITGSGTVNQ